jgi:uncharacterized membrane protein (DUF4010 family)
MDEDAGVGGIRTFILLSTAGAASGWLSSQVGSPWVFVVTLVLAVAFLIAGYTVTVHAGVAEPGLTTEIAALVTVLLGGLVMFGWPGLAVGLGITTAAVLAFKAPLHGLVDKVGQKDLYAALSLLIASFIILPILPDRNVDPLDALNPRSLWLLVILITAMSEVGYIAVRALGSSTGTALTGFLGGIASSTAVTLSFARKSKEDEAPAAALAAGILLAWLVMVLRIVILVFAVQRPLMGFVAVPIAVMGVLTLVAVIVFLRQGTGQGTRPAENVALRNPFSLGAAMRFALFFALILLVVAAVRKYFPPTSMYFVAGIAGITDVDAITLSMARMAREGGGEQLAARAIIIAAVTNTLIKGGMVVALGSRELARRVAPAALIILLSGLVAAFLA